MKIRAIIGSLKPYYRNRQWILANTKITDKISLYPELLFSHFRIIIGKRYLKYLGHRFYFDNPATPLNMMLYPYDLDKRVLKFIATPLDKVLDIGGNIGQFSATLLYYRRIKKLDIFEPNSEVLDLLAKNLKHAGNSVRIFNYALSSQVSENKELYFEPGRSATGSLLIDNAGEKKHLKKVTIKTTNKPSELTKTNKYDLIKVDVEGHEIEAIEALKEMRAHYLFIEISSEMRDRNYTESDLFDTIKKSLGNYKILYMTGYKGDSEIYEMLLEFVK